MSDEPTKQSRGWMLWGIPAALAAYVLSAGPAARLCDAFNANPCSAPAAKYRAIYGQLFDIAEKTGTRKAVYAYVEWFRDPRRRVF